MDTNRPAGRRAGRLTRRGGGNGPMEIACRTPGPA